ncbi:MAG: DUF1501 domain-containing protein [Planctomycetia bacterium]|nr:DUF1501 domain-containing protein [Planctomycetia bacterium]
MSARRFASSLEAAAWTRRRWLQAGAFGLLGVSSPRWMSHLAAAAEPAASGSRPDAKAKNVLVILEQGGMSHLDTWDPKPEMVAEHRSPYKPIDTNVPGMRFTELLPKTARLADKLAVVRSFHHKKAGADAHPNGTQYVLSGAHPGNPILMPDIGSVVSKIVGTKNAALPPYVMVPGNNEQNAVTATGYLSQGYRVFKTGGSDLSDPRWKVGDLLPREDNTEARMKTRRSLLHELNRSFVTTDPTPRPLAGMDRFYDQAFDTLTSPDVTRAFDVQGESAEVRERYGAGHRGACYLMGRKLIESGVRFVTVDTRWPRKPEMQGGGNLNWDHHDFIYAKETCELPGASGAGAGRFGIAHWVMMGSVDQAYSALIEDLDRSGLLAETLVCFVTEFGRTPKINKFQGRDHWPHAYSMVFAGAGVRGGQIIGRTDDEGGYPVGAGYTPEDYAATIYEKLGIDRDRPLYTEANRPIYFGHMGEPIPGLL